MAQTERLYRRDLVKGLQIFPGLKIVPLVEVYTKGNEHFKIHQKTTGTDISREALTQELRNPRPLLAFWKGALHPILSDPYDQIQGAVAIDTRANSLIYSSRAFALHSMRDSYRWSYGTLNDFYAEQGFMDTLEEFLAHGYRLHSSDFLVVDAPGFEVVKQEEISPDMLVHN